jgi:hypothetical protein
MTAWCFFVLEDEDRSILRGSVDFFKQRGEQDEDLPMLYPIAAPLSRFHFMNSRFLFTV